MKVISAYLKMVWNNQTNRVLDIFYSAIINISIVIYLVKQLDESVDHLLKPMHPEILREQFAFVYSWRQL